MQGQTTGRKKKPFGNEKKTRENNRAKVDRMGGADGGGDAESKSEMRKNGGKESINC
jgi:hypothetical protein